MLLLLCAIVLIGMRYTLERFEIQEFIYIPPQMDLDADWAFGSGKSKKSKRKKKRTSTFWRY